MGGLVYETIPAGLHSTLPRYMPHARLPQTTRVRELDLDPKPCHKPVLEEAPKNPENQTSNPKSSAQIPSFQHNRDPGARPFKQLSLDPMPHASRKGLESLKSTGTQALNHPEPRTQTRAQDTNTHNTVVETVVMMTITTMLVMTVIAI